MATVTISETNVYEQEKEQVWAEEYAKRLTDALEAKHDNEVGALADDIEGLADGTLIEDGAIKNRHIDNGEVDSDQIATGAIKTRHIDNGQVDTDQLANGAVKTAKIDQKAVTGDKIALGAVDAAQLAIDAVTETKIKNLQVKTGKIDNFAVTANKLATDAVTTAKIKDGAVTIAKLAPDARVLHEYNTAAPVKIGTWTHNGTTKNIYRKAFQIDYDDLIAPPTIEFADLGLDLDYYDEVVIIDRKCVLIIRDMQPRNVGDVVPAAQEGNVDHEYIFSFHALPSTIQNYLRDDGGIFYGYIDYIYVSAN